MTERVLNFDHALIPQETGYNCGPASAQVALSCRGLFVDESTLARECGTDSGGTDYVGLIERCLNDRLPERPYRSVYAENYPSTEKKAKFWNEAIVPSINAGYSLVTNWVVPANNRPVGIKGSASPGYGNKTTYHYTSVVGYDDGWPGGAVYIADSGFWPWEYWISFDQLCTLIPPKGFCYSIIRQEDDVPTQEEWNDLVRKVDNIERQLGPWPQLGQNEQGQDLTLIDATASIKHAVEGGGGGTPFLQTQAGEESPPTDTLS
jgi:Peptidase_C39 like family